jgi:hypothetical protein
VLNNRVNENLEFMKYDEKIKQEGISLEEVKSDKVSDQQKKQISSAQTLI